MYRFGFEETRSPNFGLSPVSKRKNMCDFSGCFGGTTSTNAVEIPTLLRRDAKQTVMSVQSPLRLVRVSVGYCTNSVRCFGSLT